MTSTLPVTSAGQQPVMDRVGPLTQSQQTALLERLRRRRATAVPPPQWVLPSPARPSAKLRLFCFSYAGGGASMFRSWTRSLPAEVEVCAIQLPGRETRMSEPAHRRLGPLVDALAEQVLPLLDRPYAFFGHSMGALVAFELARELRRVAAAGPERLLLAAYRAPHLPNPNIRIHHLPDEVLKIVLQNEGTAQSVLQNEELMKVVLPTLRADFELCDTHEHVTDAPFECPVSIFGGVDDIRVRPADLEGWRCQAAGEFSVEMFPGAHFFLHSAHVPLLAAVDRRLRTHLTPSSRGR